MNDFNENNLQFLDEEVSNLVSEENKTDNENDDGEDNLVTILKYQNESYKNAVIQKNKEIEESEKENNSLKISILKLQEQILSKDNIINDLNTNITKIKNQNLLLKEENKELNTKNNQLSYQNIELKQRAITNLSLQKISQKYISFSARESSKKEEEKGIESAIEKSDTNKAKDKLTELEIENEKIKFENKILKDQIESSKIDRENEITILKSLHKKEIDNYEKYASMLKSQLEDLYNTKNENLNINKDIDDMESNSRLLSQISLLESKIKQFDEENFKLKSEVAKATNEASEMKIKLENKEQIISRIQSDFQKILNQCKEKITKLEQAQSTYTNNDEENQQIISSLMEEKQNLLDKIAELNNGFVQLKQGVDEANDLFLQKQAFMEGEILKARNKAKEYKTKIQILKIKIDELHEEISVLKGENAESDDNVN